VSYGKELILDLHHCDPATFTRASIEAFFIAVCSSTGMQREDLHFWDDVGVPKEERQTGSHLVGTSAIQFITTSNITIHTLDLLGKVFINFFSCKDFDAGKVRGLAITAFGGYAVNFTEIERQ